MFVRPLLVILLRRQIVLRNCPISDQPNESESERRPRSEAATRQLRRRVWRQGLCKDNCAPDKGRMNISGCAQFMHARRHIHLGQHAQGSPPNLYDLNMKWDEMPKIADGVAPLPRPKVNPLLHDVRCPLGGGAPVGCSLSWCAISCRTNDRLANCTLVLAAFRQNF